MSTDALKMELISRIAGITDQGLLESVRILLAFHCEEEPYILNDEERAAIAEGRRQIAAGDFKTNEEVHEEITAWLKK